LKKIRYTLVTYVVIENSFSLGDDIDNFDAARRVASAHVEKMKKRGVEVVRYHVETSTR